MCIPLLFTLTAPLIAFAATENTEDGLAEPENTEDDLAEPEGYQIANLDRLPPEVAVGQDAHIVTSNQDVQNYIDLEFEKKHSVKLILRYLDNAHPEQTLTYSIPDGGILQEHFELIEGYKVSKARLRMHPEFELDMSTKTVTLNPVTRDYVIELEFEKIQFNVVVRIIYEDGAFEDHVNTYTVPYGDPFFTDFTIQSGYSVSKVNFNTSGISINSKRQTIMIDRVTNPVEINIRVNT